MDDRNESMSVEWTDLLQTEGINKHGYGLIPKLVMTDHSISITAKAIYAYLCSLAGSGSVAFPGRDKIVSTLSINKETYYTHMKQLIDRNYIKVSRKRSGKLFERNIYTLCVYVDASGKPVSVKATGYGMIPRAVTSAPDLSAKAKALYAYFTSFKGAGEGAFPKVPDILHHMDISRNTYKKILDELTSAGYVIVRQIVNRGRLSQNYFILPDYPKPQQGQDPDETKPVKKKKNTVSTNDIPNGKNVKKECVKNPDMINPDVKKPDIIEPDIIIPDVINPDTTNNSPPINSSSIINPIYQQALEMFDTNEDADIIVDLSREGDPYAISLIHMIDRLKMRKIIEECIGLDVYDPPDKKDIRYLISLVVDACQYPSLVVNKQEYPKTNFVPKLLNLGIEEYQYVLEQVGKRQQIKNLKAYYIACLYNAKEDLSADIAHQIRNYD